MTAPVLEVRNLSAGYGRNVVVEGVSFVVGDGQFLAIVGPNGSGKSTLLKGIVGMAEMFGGEVLVHGEMMSSARTEDIIRHGVTLVPQGHPVFPHMTVLENLEIGGATVSATDRSSAIGRALDLFPQLADRAKQRAGTLSGGEMQMLSVGRALMTNPDVIFFDEPSIGLAPMLVDTVFEIIGRLRQTGKAVVVVEQRARRALSVADYGMMIRTGRVAALEPASWFLEGDRLNDMYLGRAGAGPGGR